MTEPKPIFKGPAAAARRSILQKHGYRCARCGVSLDSASIHFEHIHPSTHREDSAPENLTVLCPNCHFQLDHQPPEIEFVSFLVGLLQVHSLFTDVEQEPVIGDRERLRPDILARRRVGNVKERLVIECKTTVRIGMARIDAIAHQLIRYVAHVPGARPVLAVPVTLSDEQRTALTHAHIEIWDLPVLADLFGELLPSVDSSFYRDVLLNHLLRNKCPTREEKLISTLVGCQAGRQDWLLYQKIIGEILEQLFYPSLKKPISELSDKPKVNRRDFILPNYAESGFWAFLRSKYQADYIVVDAKNYSKKIGKSEILQIANYLKPHGAGLFGIICSRHGGDEKGCEHTLREQWLVHQKLILVLNDEDLSAMLIAKSEGRGADEILAAKIEAFRLSM